MGALVAPLIGAAGSLLGGLFGGQPAVNKFSSSGSGTQTQAGSQTQSTAPVFDPAQQSLRNEILGAGTQQLTSAPANLAGIQSQMLQNTNQGYGDAQNILRQTLAARGLTYSPLAGAAESNLQTQRIGAGINVMNQMPLLREQLYQQRLQNALNAFRGIPFGTTGTGTSNMTGSNTFNQSGTSTAQNPGGPFGGLFSAMAGLGGQDDLFGQLFNGRGGNSGPGPYNPYVSYSSPTAPTAPYQLPAPPPLPSPTLPSGPPTIP